MATIAILKTATASTFLVIDILVIKAITKDATLRSHPIMVLNACLVLTEIFKIGAQVTHEYPNEIFGHKLYDCPLSDIWAVWSLVPWFWSVYLYPIIGFLHLTAIYRPVTFKTLRKQLAYWLGATTLCFSCVMTAAYVVPSCGIYMSNHLYWQFNFDRAPVYYMEQFNYILTCFSIGFTVFIDLIILYRVVTWTRHIDNISTPSGLTKQQHKISLLNSTNSFTNLTRTNSTPRTADIPMSGRSLANNQKPEIRLAINFFCVFFIFVYEFIAFNVAVKYEGVLTRFILLTAAIVSNGKGTVFLIFSKYIRQSLFSIWGSYRVCSSTSVPTTP